MKKRILIAVLGTLLVIPQTVFAIFENGGFETGDLTGWSISHGYNDDGMIWDVNNIPIAEQIWLTDYSGYGWTPGHWSDLDYWGDGLNDWNTGLPRAARTVGGSDFDPIAPLLPVVYPYGGKYSVMVNSQDDSNHASRIWQDWILTAEDITAGVFYFAAAAVLENHDQGDPPTPSQPYYHVIVTKNPGEGETILKSVWFYAGQQGGGWQTIPAGSSLQDAEWLWVPWKAYKVTLTNAVEGDIIRIELIAADCSGGGHGGYGYYDAFGTTPLPGATELGESTTSLDMIGDGLNIFNCGTVFGVDGKGGQGPGPWSGAALFTLFFALFLLPVWLLKRFHGGKRSFARPALLCLLVVLALCLATLPAAAGEIVPKAQRFHPTSDGFGTLTLDSDEPLGKGGWAFVSTLNFVSRPLNFGDAHDLEIQQDVVRNLATLDLAAAYGFCKNFQVGIDVPINILYDGLNIHGEKGNSTGWGDIRLNGKWRFLSRPTYGLAFVPYMIIPAGNENFLLTEGRYSFGGKFAGHFAYSEKLTLLANLGLQQVGNPFKSRIYSAWLQYGLGLDYKLSGKSSIVAELNGETTLDKMWDSSIVSPFELLAAYRRKFTPRWTYELGGGIGMNKGIGAPAYRTFIGVAYQFGAPKAAPAPPPPPPPAPEPPPPPPAPAPEPPPPAPKPVKETISLKILFDTAKHDIKPMYHDEIARVAAYLKKYPETNVTIEGHTDSVDSVTYNQKLSENRAESVKKYLVEKFGIDASIIFTKGYGESKPIADNATPEGRQQNRRIEATFR